MSLTHIPYRDTGYFSALICDLIDQHPGLSKFVNRPPDIEAFGAQIEEKKTQFTLEKRTVLYDSIKMQYDGYALSDALSKNISALTDPTCFTITTGHQLNLFTGPLYFVFKIVSTINLCKQLKARYPEHHFVPVYWMASEDHDFEEISFFNFQGRKIKWTQSSQGAVGRLPLDDLQPLLDLFEQSVGGNDAAKKLKNWINQSYRSSSTLAEATRRLVHTLFNEHGLVIIDADSVALKKEFLPFVQQELTENHCLNAVNDSIDKMRSTYNQAYRPQVNPRDINLFYLTESLRERIVKTAAGFATLETKQEFTEAEMFAELNAHPERFSPNVLMRPLYQEVILPNLCYIGGGGELAYWVELKGFFETQKVPFPILLLRNSAVLVPEKINRKIQRLDVEKTDLFLDRNRLINKKIRQISNIDLDLRHLKDKLKEQFEVLEGLVQQTDASFEGVVNAQKQKQFKGIDVLERRLLKAQKRKLADQVERLVHLHQSIFPNESLQERYANFFEFYLNYGDALLPEIFNALDPLSHEFTWLELP